MKIILYSAQTSARLSYIIDFFSKQISDEAILITRDINTFLSSDAIKINYSENKVSEHELWIQPQELLFEKSVQLQDTHIFLWNNLKVFFKTEGDIPFDIFAASFYLLSRYEEYLPFEEDMYGRYAHTNSLAFKNQFLRLPLINLWIEELKRILQSKSSSFTIHHSLFTFLPTYDIDIAYAYLHKPFISTAGGFCTELFTARWKQLAERVTVFGGWKKDPFDTYEWLDDLHEKFHLKPYYFFLLAEQRKGYDRNISPITIGMRQLVKELSEKYDAGIHPSWQSGDDENVLKKEISLLQRITGKPVTKSRQHYIRMCLPQTYRLLIEHGINEDHSMGYGSINGFRASVASPFYWYDLERETQTSLLIRPFCFMEANAYFEQNYTAKQAGEELQEYHDITGSVGGELITIFHNHFITAQKQWLPWRNMYEAFLEKNFG